MQRLVQLAPDTLADVRDTGNQLRHAWEFRRALPDSVSRAEIRSKLEPRLPVPWGEVEVVRSAGYSHRATVGGVGGADGCCSPAPQRTVLPLRRSAANRRRMGGVVGRPFPQAVVDGIRTDALLGNGFAIVHAGSAPDCGARSVEAASLGPVIVRRLARQRVTAVLVRPDRVVCAAVNRRGGVEGTVAANEWLPMPATRAGS